ncbi:DUF488 family protein [Canibacter oris]|uniref:DUF488 domain-containing protein n=1 Tax=Canibacter oris TaxID=1365628 RepID=A0A840DJD2_9MICO|nr:DUF488 domain-containing protein [Canibacter oris]MBB4071592.1 hypothetical protein [Canibacter oris]
MVYEQTPTGVLKERRLAIHREIRHRENQMHECLRCGEEFKGRRHARFCSSRCRTAASRTRQKHTIASIGYEGKTPTEVISELKRQNVNTLIDVRLNALSRKKGFSKTALTIALQAEGIEYLHFRALGNQKTNRAGYAELKTPVALAARDRFRQYLDSEPAQEQLQTLRVLRADKTRRIALFCFEHDTCHCHREQIIEALLQ